MANFIKNYKISLPVRDTKERPLWRAFYLKTKVPHVTIRLNPTTQSKLTRELFYCRYLFKEEKCVLQKSLYLLLLRYKIADRLYLHTLLNFLCLNIIAYTLEHDSTTFSKNKISVFFSISIKNPFIGHYLKHNCIYFEFI